MNSDDPEAIEQRHRLILASALLHTAPPVDYVRANCARVLRHALAAAGLWSDYYKQGAAAALHGHDDDDAYPLVRVWYSTLINMILCQPAADRLLDGAGNFVGPAAPYYTACWLTPQGKAVAEQILGEHPDLKSRLLAD